MGTGAFAHHAGDITWRGIVRSSPFRLRTSMSSTWAGQRDAARVSNRQVASGARILCSHHHWAPFSDGLFELDHLVASSYLIRGLRLQGVVQDERLTRPLLARAAGGNRRALHARCRRQRPLLHGGGELAIRAGEAFFTSPRFDPFLRCTNATLVEVEWDPLGTLGNLRFALPQRDGCCRRGSRNCAVRSARSAGRSGAAIFERLA